MHRAYKYYLLVFMALFLTGCPPPCEYMLMDYGSLSEEAIGCSPYLNGESYSFVHSEGQEISFLVSRTREMQTEYHDDCTELRLESDISMLTPDYPLFSCNVGMRKNDTAQYSCLIWVGESSFWLPFTVQIELGHIYFDSVQIGQSWYRDVYKIGNNWREDFPEEQILADSIYYNTSHGFLKILMTNGEYYEISD